ncbi:Hypothetical predicted protein [Podarcis lilfordi]|uniref:Uncharacterized protein n=1 Tax=Podarcis lilfordi TaxID=74358 RepID=A0AA35LL26_9SAUR|nr:Hypothetical predicted protein [Podarcis lilfordi]
MSAAEFKPASHRAPRQVSHPGTDQTQACLASAKVLLWQEAVRTTHMDAFKRGHSHGGKGYRLSMCLPEESRQGKSCHLRLQTWLVLEPSVTQERFQLLEIVFFHSVEG